LPILQDFPVPIPPLEEQDAIVAWIEEHTRNLDRSIATIRREIDLIREYRTRLVADVVTGKLDVRGLTLPAESREEAAGSPLAHAEADADESDLGEESEGEGEAAPTPLGAAEDGEDA